MLIHGKENILEPSFFTFSTHVIIWWADQVKYHHQKYDDIIMETVKYKNGEYCVADQGIAKTKTSTFQEICIYTDR